MRKFSLVLVVALLLSTASVAFAADWSGTFMPGRNGTQAGKVTIQDMGASLKVTLEMTAADATTAQPAHIHVGACPGVGAVAFPLTSVVNGKSETTVNTTMANLQATQHAINVHKSASEAAVYVACVEIPLAQRAVAAPAQLPRTGAPAGLAVLLGAAFLGIGAVLRRR